ncbi:hypothetical protein BD414DRAFT_52393 [Trametes punicea]|nr:hypothetical protein BD414DRAFT_52393 [Trametes punicea]
MFGGLPGLYIIRVATLVPGVHQQALHERDSQVQRNRHASRTWSRAPGPIMLPAGTGTYDRARPRNTTQHQYQHQHPSASESIPVGLPRDPRPRDHETDSVDRPSSSLDAGYAPYSGQRARRGAAPPDVRVYPSTEYLDRQL